MKGEDLLQLMERHIKGTFSDEVIEEEGGLETAARELLLTGASTAMAEGFFGGVFTGSLPTTDMRQRWRLFNLWTSKRAGLMVQRGELRKEAWERMRREARAGRAWYQLGVGKLGALMKLSPKEIIEIRDGSKFSLASFRETLGRAVEEIELTRLSDEREIQDATFQAWGDVQKEAEAVERDLESLEMETGVAAGFTPLALTLGVFPFPIAQLAASLMGGTSLVSITRHPSERKKHEERSGCILLESRESQQE